MLGTAKQKISTKTLSDKYEALKINCSIPKKDMATEYNVPRNTTSTWFKNKEIVSAFESANNCSMQKLNQVIMTIWIRLFTSGL